MKTSALILIFVAGSSIHAQDTATGTDQAPINNAGQKYISIGCSNDLKKLSLWWAATDPSFAKSQLCSPKVTAVPSQNEKIFTVTVTSSSPGSKPIAFQFGDGKIHPCDRLAQRRPKINGVDYVTDHTGGLDTIENAKKNKKDMDLW